MRKSRWDRTLTIIIGILIAGAVGALIYTIASPVHERCTEFYILGSEGEAADYPKVLEVNKEGIVTLEIVNREQETASYVVKLKIEGEFISFKAEIEEGVWRDVEADEGFPLTLNNGEKWEHRISFAPTEACASTTLTDKAEAKSKTIQVASVEHLKDGDYIWIGTPGEDDSEFVQIEKVDSPTITLSEELKHTHPAGTKVTELQKVEFLLYKDGGGEPYRSLHLWIDVRQE